MGFLLMMVIRLLPAGLIVFIRQGAIQHWLLGVVIVFAATMIIVNSYIDTLRGYYYANEYNPTIADPLRARIERCFPLRVGLGLAHIITLILLALV